MPKYKSINKLCTNSRKIVNNKRELIKIMTSSLISNPIIFGLDLISFGISYFISSQPPFFDFHLFSLLYFSFYLIHFFSLIISRFLFYYYNVFIPLHTYIN